MIWRKECPVNRLRQHVLFLGRHHHNGVAANTGTGLAEVRWHDDQLDASGERKVLDFDLRAWQ
jgi:hypothetical protein